MFDTVVNTPLFWASFGGGGSFRDLVTAKVNIKSIFGRMPRTPSITKK